jgi:plastocyanin
VRRTLVVAIAVVALASLTMTGIASAKSAGKTITVNLAGITFNGKANNTAKAKVGDSLKFVWKNGVHNVVSSAVPSGAKKVNSGAPTQKHAPLTVALTKKGTYSFYCVPHKALGMTMKVTVS